MFESDAEPWPVLRRHNVFLSTRLRFNDLFVRHLNQHGFLTPQDRDDLLSDLISRPRKVQRLLDNVLPSKPPEMFAVFCEILKSSGQPHIAQRLLGDSPTVDTETQEAVAANTTLAQSPFVGKMHELEIRATRAEERARELETVATLAREETLKAKEETEKAKKDAQLALKQAEQTMMEKKGEQLLNVALRYKELNDSTYDQSAGSLPSWRPWDIEIPDGVQQGVVAEIDGRLSVATLDGSLHLLTKEGDKWEAYVRENGCICGIMPGRDFSLVLVQDQKTRQFVVERFCLNEDDKWQSQVTLPSELQLLFGVSVALHEDSLYAVGGMNRSFEKVNTARVCDLRSGVWLPLDDMQTKRSFCSCLVFNDTVYVGGGGTNGINSCCTVEALRLGCGGWRTDTCTTNYECSLVDIGNRLVATGGETRENWPAYSDSVELFDDRSCGWLSLPCMTQKRSWHGVLVSQNYELVAAGGVHLNSVESLCFS